METVEAGLLEKCIICGRKIFHSVNNENQQKLFNSWKKKCSKSLSEVLLGSEGDPLCYYFNNGVYCSSCEQTVRDVNFTGKLLNSLQNKMQMLSQCIRRDFFGNYQNIPEKSNENVIKERLKRLGNDDDAFKGYSYNEIVEMLYFVVCRGADDKNLFQEENQDFENVAANYVHVKMEPAETKLWENYSFENLSEFADGIETHSSDEERSTENVKTEDNSDESSKFNPPAGSSKKKAVLRMKRKSSDSKSEDEIKTNESQLSNTFSRSDSLIRSSKKRAEIRIQQSVADRDSSESEEDKRKTKEDEREAKRRERQEKRNILRRAKRKADPNHYKRLKCTYENCSVTFYNETRKETHIRKIHLGEEKPFKCTTCSKTFKHSKSLTGHVKTSHSGNHLCKFCGKAFEEEQQLNAHYEGAHQGPNPFTCAFCDKVCSNAVDLHKHVSDSHPNFERPQCNICSKYFMSEASLKIHKLIHNDPNSLFKCELCNRVFATRHRLIRHNAIHNEENNFLCSICGQSFKTSESLQHHSAARHSNKEKRFKCKICGMSFYQSSQCKRHEIIHSGVKDFSCLTCGKQFSVKYKLMDHEKIHEREKDPTIVVRKRNKSNKIPENNPVHFH